MKDWQERVVEEKKELDSKLEALQRYLDANDIKDGLLVEQAHFMSLYSTVLELRINEFKEG